MEGNGAANGATTGHPAFVPQDEDTRPRDSVTGERTGPRHLLSSYNSHNWRSGGRARGACLAERIIEVREIPRWPESSSDGTAYVMHKSDLREEDFEAPWFALQYSSERQYTWDTTSATLGNCE
ncbi:hypothetical protein E4U19_002339, partial [Claviceps sp. Clav32 group G5]